MASIKHINKLKVKDVLYRPFTYRGIVEGLIKLPCEDTIELGSFTYRVPKDIREMSGMLTYGQRIELSDMPEADGDMILHVICTVFDVSYKDVLKAKAKEIYPVVVHLTDLFNKILVREAESLYRKPKAEELAAGVERLNKFGTLQTLLFLQGSFNETPEGVMLRPYEDCLTRLMLNKEQQEYQERYIEVIKEKNKLKKK